MCRLPETANWYIVHRVSRVCKRRHYRSSLSQHIRMVHTVDVSVPKKRYTLIHCSNRCLQIMIMFEIEVSHVTLNRYLDRCLEDMQRVHRDSADSSYHSSNRLLHR